MAPILKEAETTAATTTAASAPANPTPKSPVEVPTRPQPVALEIPVTINGARTLEGSDKREPFSETTQTVLVFAHGAVVRVATPLAPGQLVFLTNEKTKKEVVCQVVKSKSSGAASGYVELQFTEPSPGFWGLRIPGAPAAPAPAPTPVPRPVVPVAPAASALPKAIPPAPPLALKPVAEIPKPPAPVTAVPPAPPQPAIVPSLPPVTMPEHASAQPIAPVIPAPSLPVLPPPIAKVPEPQPLHAVPPTPIAPPSAETLAPASTLPAPAHTDLSPVQETHLPAIPPPPLRDYSKEIDAIFSLPHTSHPAPATTPEPKVAPPSSTPTSEELKLQTARLQAQLGSMLFTEAPAAPPAPAVPVAPKTEAPLPSSDFAKKILEIAHEEPKPVVKSEPKPAPPARKPVSPSLSADEEEVKIPAWLAPLSHNSEPSVAESPASSAVAAESIPEIPAIAEESTEALDADSSARSQAAVFGGQLLGESAAENMEATSPGSKKGLIFALAAAAVLIAGGGLWYFRATLFGSSPVTSAKTVSLPAPASSPAASNVPAANKVSTPAAATVTPAPVSSAPIAAQPTKNSEPVSTRSASTPAQSKNSNPPAVNTVAEEPVKKSALGDVHLAAPVVSHEANPDQAAEALPSIDVSVSNSGADALAAVATTHRKEPAAPLSVGGEVKQAQLIKSVPPIYPMVAKSEHISGNVQIDALIDASGNVAQVKVLSGPIILHRAALDAVKQWKYKPAMLDGQPTSMHLTVTVQFRAQ